MGDRHLLVDARPIHHPTAGGRGIGNYTLGLLHGLAEIGASFTALVSRPADTARLDGLPPATVDLWRRDVVRRLSSPDTWYIATGLFLHPISFDPIPSLVTESRLPVAGVMYDVIPYRFPELYQVEENAARQAALRAPLARTVDLTVAISQFSADTATVELGLDPRSIRVIGAGVGRRFVPPEGQARSMPPTAVAVTGPGERKNTDGLLRGWALVPAELRGLYRLVVVAGGPPTLLDGWRRVTEALGCRDSVEFAGAVSEVEMVELLQQAALVVQPSLEEGFGLPVVEAAACGAAVICSNVSSLPEVLDEPHATFDPRNPDDIARAIERGLTDKAHREVLLRAASRAAERWRWDRVAGDLIAAISEREPVDTTPRPPRRRIAVVTRPARSTSEAGADTRFIAELAIAADAEVVTLVDTLGTDERVEVDGGGGSWPAAALGRYVKYHEFDHVVTMIDGRHEHAVATRIAREYPTHVWFAAGSVSRIEIACARSVIVETAADAAVVGGEPPLLVMSQQRERAVALADWLTKGRSIDASAAVAGPADTLS